MKHRFLLNISVYDSERDSIIDRPKITEEVETDDLLQLVLQFTMIIAKIEKQLINEKEQDDTIPF